MRFRESLLAPTANNFTVLRLILASAVIYTHAFVLTYPGPDRDELSGLLGAPVSTYAVDGFFFLSGFLVYPSLIRLRPFRFLLARLARLWPALCLVVLLTVAAGAALTQTPGLAYLKGATAHFLLGNLSFVKGYYTLTAVKCGAEPCNVNQSLWTLPFEARCYLTLALLGLTGLSGRRAMLGLILPLTVLGAFAWDFAAVRDAITHLIGPGPAYILGDFHRLWPLFALGCIAYVLRERLVLSWWILAALLGAVLLAVALRLGVAMQVRALFVGYMVLCLGFLSARNGSVSGRWPDYSYGMYIFAPPVMMALYMTWRPPSHWLLAVATLVLTLPLAAMSWHGLEKPCLNAFRRWNGRRATLAVAAATVAPVEAPSGGVGPG